MKMRTGLWVLLLSAALILTFMPMAAFADDTAAEPVSAVYEGAPLRGVVNTNRVLSLEEPSPGGNWFTVTFSDGSEKTFRWPESYDESADSYPEGAFVYDENTYLFAEVYDDGKTPVSFQEGWNNNIRLHLSVHYVAGSEEKLKSITTYDDVICVYDNKPLSVTFVPAEGFTLECPAGPNYLTDELFYGEGNEFVVRCEGWDAGEGCYTRYNRHYKYIETEGEDGETVRSFALNGRPNYLEFSLDEGVDCDLAFGEEYDVEFSYSEYIDELGDFETVTFTVPVKATKYNAYADWPIYGYTGSKRTAKFKVYDNDDNLIDPSEYTVANNTATKMGWYDAEISFKDKEKYVDPVIGTFGIGPAAPKLTKLTAGKKSLTVAWKKLSAAQLKNVDGFYIELSTSKGFGKDYKVVKASKADIKAGKKVVKNLKKDKTYYVRMFAFKKITQDGEKFNMPSADSNVLNKKTK